MTGTSMHASPHCTSQRPAFQWEPLKEVGRAPLGMGTVNVIQAPLLSGRTVAVTVASHSTSVGMRGS
jgi:hypothetical protein